jgi:hypothetical protein
VDVSDPSPSPQNSPLDYWTPAGAVPAAALFPRLSRPRSEDRTDWLTMSVVVCIAAAMAFSIVIALAWVLGH